MKNKTNNPLKMLGSWIGAIVYSLPAILAFNQIGCSDWGCLVFLIPYLPLTFFINNQFLLIILIPVTGFLIGWGIQTIIRKFRRKK